MNRANVIGPSCSISAWMRAASTSSSPIASRSGPGSRRIPGVMSTASYPRQLPGWTVDDEPDAWAHERVAAEQDRDRRGGGRGGELTQPRIRDAGGQQQVRGEPVLGPRPDGLVGAEPVREQDARVDDRGVREAREMIAERRGSVS